MSGKGISEAEFDRRLGITRPDGYVRKQPHVEAPASGGASGISEAEYNRRLGITPVSARNSYQSEAPTSGNAAGITEAQYNAALGITFSDGSAPDPDPGESTMTLAEAQEINYRSALGLGGVTVAMVAEAEGVIAYQADRAAAAARAAALPASEAGKRKMTDAEYQRMQPVFNRLVDATEAHHGLTRDAAIKVALTVLKECQAITVARAETFTAFLGRMDQRAAATSAGRVVETEVREVREARKPALTKDQLTRLSEAWKANHPN